MKMCLWIAGNTDTDRLVISHILDAQEHLLFYICHHQGTSIDMIFHLIQLNNQFSYHSACSEIYTVHSNMCIDF